MALTRATASNAPSLPGSASHRKGLLDLTAADCNNTLLSLRYVGPQRELRAAGAACAAVTPNDRAAAVAVSSEPTRSRGVPTRRRLMVADATE